MGLLGRPRSAREDEMAMSTTTETRLQEIKETNCIWKGIVTHSHTRPYTKTHRLVLLLLLLLLLLMRDCTREWERDREQERAHSHTQFECYFFKPPTPRNTDTAPVIYRGSFSSPMSRESKIEMRAQKFYCITFAYEWQIRNERRTKCVSFRCQFPEFEPLLLLPAMAAAPIYITYIHTHTHAYICLSDCAKPEPICIRLCCRLNYTPIQSKSGSGIQLLPLTVYVCVCVCVCVSDCLPCVSIPENTMTNVWTHAHFVYLNISFDSLIELSPIAFAIQLNSRCVSKPFSIEYSHHLFTNQITRRHRLGAR